MRGNQPKNLLGLINYLDNFPITGRPQDSQILIYSGGKFYYGSLSAGGGGLASLVSLGTGAAVYKNTITDVSYFRSLTSDTSINMAVSADEINMAVNANQPDIRSINSATNGLEFSMQDIFLPFIPSVPSASDFLLAYDPIGRIIRFPASSLPAANGLTTLENVGIGQGIFRDKIGTIGYLKSLKSVAGNITFIGAPNEINIDLALDITGLFSISGNPGQPLNINNDIIRFPLIPSNPSPVYTITANANKEISLTPYSAGGSLTNLANVGTGQGIFRNITGTTANLKSLTTSAGNINFTTNTDEINIDLNPNLTGISVISGNSGSPLILNSDAITLPTTTDLAGTPSYFLTADSGRKLYFKPWNQNINIYTSDGLLTSPRTITGGSLTFDISGTFYINSPIMYFPNVPSSVITPSFNLTMDASGRVLKTPYSGGGGGTNIYNSDGTLTGARVLTGGGQTLTFDNAQISIKNFPSYDIANNNTISQKVLTFSADGTQSAMMTQPLATITRKFQIPALGPSSGAYLFARIVYNSGVNTSNNFPLEIFITEKSPSALPFTAAYKISTSLGDWNAAGAGTFPAIYPHKVSGVSTVLPVYFALQGDFQSPNALNLYIVNSSAIDSVYPIDCTIISYGDSSDKTIQTLVGPLGMLTSPGFIATSLNIYTQQLVGFGAPPSWIWQYTLWPRPIRIRVWMQLSGTSVFGGNFTALPSNNGVSLNGWVGYQISGQMCEVNYEEVFNPMGNIPSKFVIGANTFRIAVPPGTTATNRPYRITIEII
jgi:hypothetical protein